MLRNRINMSMIDLDRFSCIGVSTGYLGLFESQNCIYNQPSPKSAVNHSFQKNKNRKHFPIPQVFPQPKHTQTKKHTHTHTHLPGNLSPRGRGPTRTLMAHSINAAHARLRIGRVRAIPSIDSSSSTSGAFRGL